jgi:hypothetical protein
VRYENNKLCFNLLLNIFKKMIISIIISYIESILMTYHTYRCMAFCSENCLPDTQNTFKTHFCKKLKTYNKCNECNVYVCKECFVQLKLHNFTKCVTCRKDKLMNHNDLKI